MPHGLVTSRVVYLMDSLAIVVGDRGNVPKLFSQVAQIYSAEIVEPEDLETLSRAHIQLIIIDVPGLSGEQITTAKRALRRFAGITLVGGVQGNSYQQSVQAQALKARELIPTDRPLLEFINRLRTIAGNYSIPDLSDEVPAATRLATLQACQAMDEIALSVISGAPIPMRNVSLSVTSISKALQSDGLNAWIGAVASHHSHTFSHSLMVTGYAVALARQLGFEEQEVTLIGVGAMLHDLGKVKIPLSILDKPGSLTAEEYELVKKHPLYSKEFFEEHPEVPQAVVDMAIYHHEYLDGSGYPYGLKGEDLAPAVRLMTICDIFAALIERRPYKEPYGPRQSHAILFEMGEKIDQKLLKTFRKMIFEADTAVVRRNSRSAEAMSA